jgi:hypothetical protein
MDNGDDVSFFNNPGYFNAYMHHLQDIRRGMTIFIIPLATIDIFLLFAFSLQYYSVGKTKDQKAGCKS